MSWSGLRLSAAPGRDLRASTNCPRSRCLGPDRRSRFARVRRKWSMVCKPRQLASRRSHQMEHALTTSAVPTSLRVTGATGSHLPHRGSRSRPSTAARSIAPAGITLSAVILALTACASTPRPPSAGPAPTDPGLAVATPHYESEYSSFRSFVPEPVAGWSQVHDEVSEQASSSGHAGHGSSASRRQPGTTGTGEHAGHGSSSSDR